MRHLRKNKKGFSLVELIIVIAIMVALVAVMAPAFVKYVKRSHDAVIDAAAESVLEYVKTEISSGTLLGEGKMLIKGVDEGTGKHISVLWEDRGTSACSFVYGVGNAPGDDGYDKFVQDCGVDDKKLIKSDRVYEIVITENDISGHPQLQAEMGIVDP